MTEYYKVIRKRSLKSAYIDLEKYVVKYRPNEWIYPQKRGTVGLMTFTSLEAAKRFRYMISVDGERTHSIYRCEVKCPKIPLWLPLVRYLGSSEYVRLIKELGGARAAIWKSIDPQITWVLPVPAGTVCCSAIKITKKVK